MSSKKDKGSESSVSSDGGGDDAKDAEPQAKTLSIQDQEGSPPPGHRAVIAVASSMAASRKVEMAKNPIWPNTHHS